VASVRREPAHEHDRSYQIILEGIKQPRLAIPSSELSQEIVAVNHGDTADRFAIAKRILRSLVVSGGVLRWQRSVWRLPPGAVRCYHGRADGLHGAMWFFLATRYGCLKIKTVTSASSPGTTAQRQGRVAFFFRRPLLSCREAQKGERQKAMLGA
jgi:hypothetical protein